MSAFEDFKQHVETISEDTKKFKKWVNGNSEEMVQTDSGPIPTLAGLIEKYKDDLPNEVVKIGIIPLDYVSGPVHLEIDGEKSEDPFSVIDSYPVTPGDQVIAMFGTIIGLLSTPEPLIESFCKYYGYPSSINSYWDVDKAAAFYAQFDGVVWGFGYQSADHTDYAATVAIAAKMRELNPSIKLFGYVPIGMDPAWPDSNFELSEIYEMIDGWEAIGATHIFLDEFGYDYYITRARQNACVDYCHNKGLFVCANSWSPDYCFSNQNIILDWIDDFEGNPDELPSKLTENDYIQFENMLYRYEHIPGEGSSAVTEQWVNNNQRIIDMYDYMYQPQDEFDGKSYYEQYGTKGYSLDAIMEYDKKMFSEGYLTSVALGMHAYAASIAFWGASANQYHVYEKPVIRANSRAALGKAHPESFNDTYMGRVTTRVGLDEIEITWVQDEVSMKFNEASAIEDKPLAKHIMGFEIPAGLTISGDGYFTLTMGDNENDDYGMSVAVSSSDTRADLINKILDFEYSSAVTDVYDITQEGDWIYFTSKDYHTEELDIWWIWHTPGILSATIDAWVVVQEGFNGLSKDYREVRVNGVAVDFGFGPFWRRPRQVSDGYVYYDVTNERNIVYRKPYWYDFNGNRADEEYTTLKQDLAVNDDDTLGAALIGYKGITVHAALEALEASVTALEAP